MKINKSRGRLILLLGLLILVLVACGTKEGYYLNKKYDSKSMKDISGQEFREDRGGMDLALGMGYQLGQLEKSLEEKGNFQPASIPELGYTFSYITDEGKELLKGLEGNPSPEEMEIIERSFFDYAAFCKISKKDGSQLELLRNIYDKEEFLTSDKEYDYYFMWTESLDGKEIQDEDKKIIEELIANKEELKKGFLIFPSQEIEKHMKNFSSKSLNGENFSQDDLAEYDLTLVKLWATWCKGCIDQMEDMEELYQKLPENVNLISICQDAESEPDLAKKILEEKGASFPCLIADDNLEESLMKHVYAYPTSLYVDSEGNILEEDMTGGDDLVGDSLKTIDRLLKDNN